MIGASMGTAVERSAKIAAAFGVHDHCNLEGLMAIQARNADDMQVEVINSPSEFEASIEPARFG